MERQITIPSGELELAATLHYPPADQWSDRPRRFPLILICHGFTGNRIGANRLFVKAARTFCRNGYLVLRFDYGGCGESTGDYGATGLGSMISQTRHVLDYAFETDCIDPNRVIVLGHSLGGAVTLLTAARDKRIRTIVLWAPVMYPFNDIVRIVGKKTYETCMERGSADYLGYRLKKQFFDSLSAYHPYQEMNKFSGDVLLVHGTADDVIPVDYSFLFQKAFWLRSEGQCDKEIILQADHTFSSGEASEEAITKTCDWLLNQDRRKREWYGWSI